MNIRTFVTSLDLSLTNTLFAIAAAVLSFIVIHGTVAFFRKRLCNLSEERAHKPVAEVLRQTLARTSKLAVLATALLIGLSVLDLPPKWDARVSNLWFITLGIQLALYAHRAIAVAAQRYFRRRAPSGVEDEQVTVAHTLITWVLQIAVWVIFLLATLQNLGINVTTLVAAWGSAVSPSRWQCRTCWATCSPRCRSRSTSRLKWATRFPWPASPARSNTWG